jgi:drug/metabolite transporter (DMT)-like permease
MQLLTGAVFVLAASAAFEPWSGLRLTARGAGSLAFLIVCGTAIGLAAYTWLLRVTTPAAVGTYAFVNPLIALLLGWAVGDDTLGARTVLATGLVVSAVLVTQWRGLLGPKRSGVPARRPGRVLPTTAPRPPESDLRGTGWLRLS